jgi:hypothetical protein
MGYVPKRKKLRSNNTTGYRGVYKMGNRFKAKIAIDGIQHYLGLFGTAKETAIAFDVAAIHAKRPRSDLNFPEMNHEREEIQKRKKRKLASAGCDSRNKTGLSEVSKNRKKYKARVMIFDGKRKHPGSSTNARDDETAACSTT